MQYGLASEAEAPGSSSQGPGPLPATTNKPRTRPERQRPPNIFSSTATRRTLAVFCSEARRDVTKLLSLGSRPARGPQSLFEVPIPHGSRHAFTRPVEASTGRHGMHGVSVSIAS